MIKKSVWLLLLVFLLGSMALGQTSLERSILTRTNQMRLANGLTKLSWEGKASRAASFHAKDMLKRGFFAHQNPDGLSAHQRMNLQGIFDAQTGENLAEFVGVADQKIVSLAMDGWMKSPGHRANILNASYTHLGVSIARSGNRVVAVQNFVGRAFPLTISVSDAPASSRYLNISGSSEDPFGVFVGQGLFAKFRGEFDSKILLPPDGTVEYAVFQKNGWWEAKSGQDGVKFTAREEKLSTSGKLVVLTFPKGNFRLGLGSNPTVWKNIKGPLKSTFSLAADYRYLWVGREGQNSEIRFAYQLPLTP